MIFKSILYNITDSEGKLVKALSIKNRQVLKKVFTGY